jgi:CheY-like chemotaxis protein
MRNRILVVGYDSGGTAALESVLRTAGLQASITASAQEAMAVLDGGGVAVVIVTEVMWPDEYGDRLIWHVKQNQPETAVFAFGALRTPPAAEWFPEHPREEGRSLFYFLAREGYLPDVELSVPVEERALLDLVLRLLPSGS